MTKVFFLLTCKWFREFWASDLGFASWGIANKFSARALGYIM
jgi:hypothetical protein